MENPKRLKMVQYKYAKTKETYIGSLALDG